METFDRISCAERLSAAAATLLRGARDAASLAASVAGYHDAAEREADAGEGRRTACRAGCPHCCVLNVTALLPEAAAIAAVLAERTPPPDLAALVDRLDRHRRTVRWMDDDERVRRGIACPFLTLEGSCSIHPFRPLACRGVTSLDAALCRASLDPCGDEYAPRVVPMDLVRRTVMDDAFLALARALEDTGMEARGIELGTGAWAFLAAPQRCASFLAGGRLPADVRE